MVYLFPFESYSGGRSLAWHGGEVLVDLAGAAAELGEALVSVAPVQRQVLRTPALRPARRRAVAQLLHSRTCHVAGARTGSLELATGPSRTFPTFVFKDHNQWTAGCKNLC